MSAFDQLPEDTQQQIEAGDLRIRADLRLTKPAEAAGWVVKFRNDHWHNPATFERGSEAVWSTGRDWRRATLEGGRYGQPAVFSAPKEALGL